MSETTLDSYSEPQTSQQEEILNIEVENSFTINMEDVEQQSKDKSNSDVTCRDEILGSKNKENTVYQNLTKNTDLNTGFVPHGRNKWVYIGLTDASKNQVPPTGDTLEYSPDRNGFVRLVFSLVFIMLLFTCIFNACVYNIDPLSDIFQDRMYAFVLLIFAILVLYVMHYVMFCSQCSRSPPCNYICLAIVTVAMSILVGVITIRYEITLIALAMGITAIISLVCLGLACTSFDFTRFLLYFIVISIALSLVGSLILILMFMLKWQLKPLHIFILFVFVCLTAVGMVMQLQMILGGRQVELGEEDYAMGAYMLYTSIIEMFLLILRILDLLGVDI